VNEQVRAALAGDRVADITTTGRRSGQPRRLEIWFHLLDGRLYVTGLPGRRDWYANLVAEPALVLHLKESTVADLPARARPVTERAERERVLGEILRRLGRAGALNDWVQRSPLVEVALEPQGARR
jgi:deazaflavin-dependent oxidoreductase (nitroreductase family)